MDSHESQPLSIEQISDFAVHLVLLVRWADNNVIKHCGKVRINRKLWIVSKRQYEYYLSFPRTLDGSIIGSVGRY